MKPILAAVVLAIWTVGAGAQQFPSKPIHLVATFAAGGAMDLTARSMAAAMSDFGQVIVENRTGGGGLIGTDYVARAAPDGYTLLMYADVNVIAPAVYKKINHDPIKDFAPITNAILGTHLIVAHPSVKANTLKELIELAKREPGKLTFGSPGTATPQHLAGELFKQQAGGLDMLHVPYRGIAPAMNDLLGGQIQVIFPNVTAQVVALHRNGKLRLLAVNAPERLEPAPDIPTAHEQGLKNFVSQIFFGIFAPIKTPKPILEKISAITQAAWADKAFLKKLTSSGFEPMLDYGPDRSNQYLRDEFAKWHPIVLKVQGPG
jgi:tripartite-type tricarboxylate transporter receptor subunit TctC